MVIEALLVLRNAGYTAELPRFRGDAYKVNGRSYTKEEFIKFQDLYYSTPILF
jgi:hypothetical protein